MIFKQANPYGQLSDCGRFYIAKCLMREGRILYALHDGYKGCGAFDSVADAQKEASRIFSTSG